VPGYTHTNVNMDKLKLRSSAAKIYKEINKPDIRFRKLEKVDGPSPGSYEPNDAFIKT
jgi:hypothetical protein